MYVTEDKTEQSPRGGLFNFKKTRTFVPSYSHSENDDFGPKYPQIRPRMGFGPWCDPWPETHLGANWDAFWHGIVICESDEAIARVLECGSSLEEAVDNRSDGAMQSGRRGGNAIEGAGSFPSVSVSFVMAECDEGARVTGNGRISYPPQKW